MGGTEDPRIPASDVRQLVTDHYQVVYRYAYRLTGRADEAEDVAQQTFLIAQEKLHQLRDSGKAVGWLLSVARSCFLKTIRRQRPTAAGDLELRVDEIPDGRVTEDDIDRERLQAAVNALPDDFRVVLVMFYFEQLSYKEIAAQLDRPIGTVMSQLSRAKGRLRHALLGSTASDKPQPAASLAVR